MDSINQNAVYYDPQRDVSVSGATQSVTNCEPHVVQSANSYVPCSTSVQHDYNAAQYPNCYYNYPQAENDSSVQQGVGQRPGAAYQPITSFQNSGSYVGPTGNTYYNAGIHQTAPGYATSNYYYHQNNAWGDGSSVNNHAQSYQSYTPDSNVAQSSSSLPTSSVHYQQQYNKWPYYYDQSAQTSGGLAVVGSTASTKAATVGSDYVHPSNQPPPPGATSWKSDASNTAAPPAQVLFWFCQILTIQFFQAPGIQGYQNLYAPQAPVAPVFQNQYVNNTAGIPTFHNQYASSPFQHSSANYNQLPLSNQAHQQKALHLHGSSSNVSSVNRVSENSRAPSCQDSVTSNVLHMVNKVQIPTNPRIAPGFPIEMPKVDKSNLEADSSQKPAYVCVSMRKNDVKAVQEGSEAVMQVTGSFPVSLRTYVERNLARCKDDAQRTASRRILKEIITKATADGTLHTKNWDIEPLLTFPEVTTGANMTSTGKDSSPFSFSSSRRSPSRRTKSRWEPVAEEKVANNVEVPKESAKSNICSSLEPTKRTSNSWDLRNFVQSRQAPLSQCSQRITKKQRTGDGASLTENGNASSDSDKEHDLMKHYASSIALANSPEEKKRREHRSKRFEQSQGAPPKSGSSLPDKDATANIYKRRAVSLLLNRSNGDDAGLAVEDLDGDALTIKGTCQEIEKEYLRLTRAPKPDEVRPEDVLEKALHMVETSEKNYLYKCDQLKSIRQDLTVQRIQNELTVKVYETHARLAIQSGDLAEYNQCQSQLKRLYGGGLKGCNLEFSAYNLLCVMQHSNSKRDLLSSMASLPKEAKKDATVKHALEVCSAVLSGNYVLFFKLYKVAPNLNSYLMDLYVERMRFEAIKCMSKSYCPTVPVRYSAQVLGFVGIDEVCEGNGAVGLEECKKWLKAHGAVLSVDNSGEVQIDTKVSSTSLYIPEPENAVSHGDASLAVDDFLA
ncbi:SAC3 family protein A [Dichanthelium oligosanthes]|uniref:SAC3 family protein A n=1 Tax=Dichanthelium oligosanthes TaxID=888268 RepID=A0A1E5ULD1_9POAL|nr:SAC3 family protein A [Dichanthelium oligosanthes]